MSTGSTFDWSSLMGGADVSSLDSAFYASLITTAPAPPAQPVPQLVHSSASSPDSTESSEASPHDVSQHEITVAGGSSNKRKSNVGPGAVAHKDARATTLGHHTHDTPDGVPQTAKSGKIKGQISEKRRDQNRAAQKAFRERKEQHVKDLETRVAELEQLSRERDAQNDNLRDLIQQLRQENERLGASGGKFAQSSFTFDLPVASTSRSVSPATALRPSGAAPATSASPALVNFPAVSVGGLGDELLAELSGFAPGPRKNSATPSTSSASSSLALPALAAPTTPSSGDSSLDIFTPGGQHLNFLSGTADSPLAGLSDWRDPAAMGADAGGDLDDYFVGLTSPRPAPAAVVAPSKSASPSASAGECPFGLQAILPEDELNSLCADMKAKATCQEYARRALEEALKGDSPAMAQAAGGFY